MRVKGGYVNRRRMAYGQVVNRGHYAQFPDTLSGSALCLQAGDSPSGHVTCSVGLGLWATQLCSPGGSDGEESACNAGDPGSVPGSGGPLEKEMATHSGVLAWETQGTEEAGGLQSVGPQRVGHD